MNCSICGIILRSHNKIGTCRKHRGLSNIRRKYENKWKSENKEQYLNSLKEWRKKNNDRYNLWFKNSRKNNVNYKLAHSLRTRIRRAIKKGSAVKNLGCSIDKFRSYLEEKFKEGMNWNNYGKWQIDHIKPLSSFNLSDPKELAKACNYKNMQPLWKHENLQKRITDNIEYASKSAGL